eukprot:scaffold107678_cov48-Phaeocystis_antarctica.AAC.1
MHQRLRAVLLRGCNMPLRGCRMVLRGHRLRAPDGTPARRGAASALCAWGRATASPLDPRGRRWGRGAADPAHARHPVASRRPGGFGFVSRGAVASVRDGGLHRRGITAEGDAVARPHAAIGEAVCCGGVRQLPPRVVAHL